MTASAPLRGTYWASDLHRREFNSAVHLKISTSGAKILVLNLQCHTSMDWRLGSYHYIFKSPVYPFNIKSHVKLTVGPCCHA